MSLSDAFVMSQYRYYKENLGFRGQGHLQVLGLYQKYQAEALKRGLIRKDARYNTFIEVPEELIG